MSVPDFIPYRQFYQVDHTMPGTDATEYFVYTNTRGFNYIGLQITCAPTGTATIAFELSLDGTTFFAIPVLNIDTNAFEQTIASFGVGRYVIPIGSMRTVRVTKTIGAGVTAVIAGRATHDDVGVLGYATGALLFSGTTPLRHFGPHEMLDAGAGWAITANAPTATDATLAMVDVREFVDTTDQGVGLKLYLPAGTTTMRFVVTFRKTTSVAGTVAFDLYARAAIRAGVTVGTDPWHGPFTLYGPTDPGADQTVITTTANYNPVTDWGLSAADLGSGIYVEIVRDNSDGGNYADEVNFFDVTVFAL